MKHVEAIARYGVLPPSTHFFAEPLSSSDSENGTQAQQRIAHRKTWLARAPEATRNADLLFADPDNGLEVVSTAAHHNDGAKYAFYSDLLPFWERRQSLAIYQHRDRSGAGQQVATRKAELLEKLKGAAFVDLVYFPSLGGGRMFFVAAQPAHGKVLRERLKGFKAKAEGHLRRI
jgi:hypothetical protein